MGRGKEFEERLAALEETVATQASIHIEVQKHIGAIHAAGQGLSQKTFLQQQQLSITHRKLEAAEKRVAEIEELTGVLEQESNQLRVDQNVYRDTLSGLSQRVDALYTALQTMSKRMQAATEFTELFDEG